MIMKQVFAYNAFATITGRTMMVRLDGSSFSYREILCHLDDNLMSSLNVCACVNKRFRPHLVHCTVDTQLSIQRGATTLHRADAVC